MLKPAYREIEDDFRAFLGRCCRAMTAHEPDAITKLVAPHFKRRVVASLECLQGPDYCHILLCNYRDDREHDHGVLFERHLVELGLDRDIRYCQQIRHKYAHLAGMEETVPAKEQFADIVIIQRTVRALTRDRPMDDADQAFVVRLRTLTTALIDQVARVIDPDRYDLDDDQSFSAAQLRSLREVIRETFGSFEKGNSEGKMIADQSLSPLLNEVRESFSVVGSLAQELALMRTSLESVRSDTVWPNGDPGTFESESEALPPEPVPDTSASVRSTPRTRRLSTEEAREELMRLRNRIWLETGTEASGDGLLRKKMIDAFLRYRPTRPEELKKLHLSWQVSQSPSEQLTYMDDIFSILARLE